MDKVLHFFACLLATITASVATFWRGMWYSITAGSLFALGLGLGKEFGDSRAPGNRWDWYDILADLLGIAAGVGILVLGWCD